MIKDSYTATIEVFKSSHEAFNCIKDVSKWRGGKDFKGGIDEFTITHPGAHYSKQTLIELIPDKKIVWRITKARFSGSKRIRSNGPILN